MSLRDWLLPAAAMLVAVVTTVGAAVYAARLAGPTPAPVPAYGTPTPADGWTPGGRR